MDQATRNVVTERAGNRCEYCHLEQTSTPWLRFHVEHIRARQHDGDDSLDNLCLACPACNHAKGPNQSGYDPIDGELTRLFHPRLDIWEDHFSLHRGSVVGLTALGRATIALLQMNRDRQARLRRIVSDTPEGDDD